LHLPTLDRSTKAVVTAPDRRRRADYVAATTPEMAIPERHCGSATMWTSIGLRTAAPRSRLDCPPAYRSWRLDATAALPPCRRGPQGSAASAEARDYRRWAGDYFLSPPHTQFTSRNFTGCMFDFEKASTRIEDKVLVSCAVASSHLDCRGRQ
jgi:hypothetical protein